MDIDKFAHGRCEACIENDEKTKIYLSCMKYLFYEAIKDGIREGISESMPFMTDIERSIKNGVIEAMPYETSILNAISHGMRN